jgi:nicotinamidase-related amidase
MSSIPGPQNDLHGSAPDSCPTALLFVDVITDFQFPDGNNLLAEALGILPNLRMLRQQAKERHFPIIYVNDNLGRWRSSFEEVVRHCLSEESRGRSFIEHLLPDKADYVVLKAKNSGFFQTSLDLLLKHLKANRLIICGFCTESCILFTAQDAYMRDFELIIPADCIASTNSTLHQVMLEHLQSTLKADISSSKYLQWP